MNIRPAQKKDLHECEKLLKIEEFKESDNTYITQNDLINYIDKNYFLVAESKSKEILGCIYGEKLKFKGVLIWYLTVKKSSRHQSIGKKLLRKFENNCKKNKREWIALNSPIENIKNVVFYKKEGFKKGKTYITFDKDI